MTPLIHIPVSAVNNDMLDDKVALQLLAKLDKGAETIHNLHSLLLTKTSELNQLLAQLELIQQVLTNVEHGTQQIELVLKEMGCSEKLLDAEATLDFALQSATDLYNNDKKKQRSVSHKPSQQQQTLKKKNNLLKKINDVLIELELKPKEYFCSLVDSDDFNVLQKAYADLDIARSIALSVKNEIRNRNATTTTPKQQYCYSIREGARLFKTYSNGQPLLLNGVNILTLLDREEKTKNFSMHTKKNRFSATESLKTPTVNNKTTCNISCKSKPSTRQEEIITLVSRPTSSSLAKIKEPRGPGYTLRLRNMLAKRNNTALKMS